MHSIEFSIINVRKQFPESELSVGSGKFGTTAAKVLRHPKFWIIESPRYKRGIKCWVSAVGRKTGEEIHCKTVEDLVLRLD